MWNHELGTALGLWVKHPYCKMGKKGLFCILCHNYRAPFCNNHLKILVRLTIITHYKLQQIIISSSVAEWSHTALWPFHQCIVIIPILWPCSDLPEYLELIVSIDMYYNCLLTKKASLTFIYECTMPRRGPGT